MVYCVYEAAKDVCQKHRASFHMGSPYWPMYITTSSLPGSASGSTNFRGLPHLPKGRIGRPLGIERCRPVLPLPQHFRECRYSWSHGSVGSPFCTDYINSVLPVPAKLPLLMGCAGCTKIGSKFGRMAQLVEHIVHIDGVTGSSPVATTTRLTSLLVRFFLPTLPTAILERM